MQAPLQTLRKFPWTATFAGQEVSFHLMSPEDEKPLREFTRRLSAEDVLYLRMDIRQPEALAEWIENVRRGRTMTVLARNAENRIIGYCSLHRNELLWTGHHGEMRVLVLAPFRGIGLGARLLGEVFQIAREQHIERIIVNIAREQPHVRTMLEHLGFQPEALLADWLKDQDGRTHDLLIMSHFVEED